MAKELLKRSELSYEKLAEIDAKRPELTPVEAEEVEIQVKYEGYIKLQEAQVEKFKKMERKLIPEDLNPYTDESVEALNNAKNAVVRDYTILQQDKVNEMATNINNAIQALEKKPPVLQIALGSTGLLGIVALIISKLKEPKKMI